MPEGLPRAILDDVPAIKNLSSIITGIRRCGRGTLMLQIKRELDGLKDALAYFGMNEGVIVTQNQSDLFEDEGITIKLIPAWRFLV